jgi:hypothetical protein
MKVRKLYLAGLGALSGFGGVAFAQVPVVPVAPAVPVAPGAVPVAPVAPAQPMTLWSFLGISKAQKEACKQKLCATTAGQFINNAFTPATMFSGGIIPPCCPPNTPTPAELADEGAVGTAAAIKASEAQAKARRAAMRYLGTVDCNRFPAASKALALGLRSDPNECVRFEAALALGNGCCCNNETMEALAIAAACSDRDKFPRETSDRVRAAAVAALQTCLSCYVDPNPPAAPVEKPLEGKPLEGDKPAEQILPPAANPPGPGTTATDKANDSAAPIKAVKGERPGGEAYYAKIREVPRHLIVAEARRVVEKYNQTASAQAVIGRQNSLVSVVNRAFADDPGLPPIVIENGVPVLRAEYATHRPKNLWDMLTRESIPPGDPVGVVKTEVVVNTTAEPPMSPRIEGPMPPVGSFPVVTTDVPPMIAKAEAPRPKAAAKPAPAIHAVETTPTATPKAVKVITPTDVGPYGEHRVSRPKTPAELAGRTRSPDADKSLAPMPFPLPAAVASEPAKPAAVRESLKPVEPVVEVAKPEPVAIASPLAQRALTVLRDAHPAAVREQIAESLSASDLHGCPELAAALLNQARGTDPESARKAAIKALVRCQANAPEVLAGLEKLTEDVSPAVRVEAAIGLARLKVGPAAR